MADGHLDTGVGAIYKNATTFSFAPSAKDMLLAVPRLAKRAGAFAYYYLPGQVDSLLGVARNTGSIIAEPTSTTAMNTTMLKTASAFAETAEAGLGAAEASSAPGFLEHLSQAFTFQNIRSFGGLFSYMTSKWAITTFAVAIVLNRTSVYALTRHHLTFNWKTRLFIRSSQIFTLLFLAQRFVQAMRCQTSPDFAMMRYGDPERRFASDFAGEGGFIYRLSSAILFWQNDRTCCSATGMIGTVEEPRNFSGSLSMLWPLFVSICFSQFIETISCALQGRQTMPETVMTIFEHSLAFAEAEAIIDHAIGLLGLSSSNINPVASNATTQTRPSPSAAGTAAAVPLVNKSLILQRLNVPPELLLISFVSILSHLSSHVLGVFDLQARYRLINTTIWGVCFMSAFTWSFMSLISGNDDLAGPSILRIPTVCIIAFIPHILILIGIFVCGAIYALALAINMMSPPAGQPDAATFRRRLRLANDNLLSNVQLSSIRISWQEDFYTTLLKVGFAMLTAASEAVYFNESLSLRVTKRTWLEEKRLKELMEDHEAPRRILSTIPSELRSDSLAEGVGLVDEYDRGLLQSDGRLPSGYARERKTQNVKPAAAGTRAVMSNDSVGVMQRGGRWLLTGAFMKGIFWLSVGIAAKSMVMLLRKVGVTRQISWLEKFAGTAQHEEQPRAQGEGEKRQDLEFWMITNEGNIVLPSDWNVDVEAEMRRRLQPLHSEPKNTEKQLDKELYNWWKRGGWWGEVDSSGGFQPKEQDDDTTSIISEAESSTASVSDWGTELDNDDGRRTPTQRDPYGHRDSTPSEDTMLDRFHLAHLLDPKTLEDRQEAQILARHLNSDRIMTRSQYRRSLNIDRAKVLTTARDLDIFGHSNTNTGGPLDREEEEQLLEQVILSRRQEAHTARFQQNSSSAEAGASEKSWDAGAAGMGDSGPQCVVCQSSPRTVLVWPCRCLSLCEECRISLALKNFGSCVCCRRDVVAFSRLFVP